jgi:thiamine kinase-like enzyme
VNLLEHILGREWEIIPAGGATGEAFIALNKDQKLFLKRNSSPFLAVLSAEGIVPKLIWTKRLENGDVITAQHWLDGRELSHEDMDGEQVARLLRKIHQSEPLLSMLKRLGKSPLRPESILTQIETSIDKELVEIPVVNRSISFLQKNLLLADSEEKVVCHCDVNHNNWLISETDELFLIDWDGAMIADPAIDLGVLLYSYIPKKDWRAWLGRYGKILDANLEMRMKWHVIAQVLSSIQWHRDKERIEEMNTMIQNLNSILAD